MKNLKIRKRDGLAYSNWRRPLMGLWRRAMLVLETVFHCFSLRSIWILLKMVVVLFLVVTENVPFHFFSQIYLFDWEENETVNCQKYICAFSSVL